MQGGSAHKSRRVHAFAASALQFMQAQYALAASDVDSMGAGREDGPAGRARIARSGRRPAGPPGARHPARIRLLATLFAGFVVDFAPSKTRL